MNEQMMEVLHARIDEILSNSQVKPVLIKMHQEGKTDEEIRDFVQELAIASLLYGESR